MVLIGWIVTNCNLRCGLYLASKHHLCCDITQSHKSFMPSVVTSVFLVTEQSVYEHCSHMKQKKVFVGLLHYQV